MAGKRIKIKKPTRDQVDILEKGVYAGHVKELVLQYYPDLSIERAEYVSSTDVEINASK